MWYLGWVDGACLNQVLAVRHVCEKYPANGKGVFKVFMDLEKGCDTIDRHGVWQMLIVYGVGGKLLNTVQNFSVDSRACIRGGMYTSEWFQVNVRLKKGCLMFPRPFNVYRDGALREVNARVLWKWLGLLH